MEKSAEKLLLKLYTKKELAPFYIIRGPISSSHCPLFQWAHDFAQQLLIEDRSISVSNAKEILELGHRDLLFISKPKDGDDSYEQDEKAYKVDDPQMREYFKAVQYGPMELGQKFIFIDKAQLINEYFANKWLKTLEEPAENVTTLFLVETQSPLLDTIESRAITFRVQTDLPENFYRSPEQHEDFTSFLKRFAKDWTLSGEGQDKIQLFCQRPNEYHHLLDALRESPQLKSLLLELMSDYMLSPNHSLRAQQHWLEELQWFKKAKTFNNSATERFLGLLMCVTESTSHKVNS